MGGEKVKLKAPYYSQKLDVKDPFWKSRSCGIASLKMAMAYLRRREFLGKGEKLDSLIEEGLKKDAYLKSVGWIHGGLVRIAKAHGFKKSFRKEWNIDGSRTSINAYPLRYIVAIIRKGIPVLASVKSRTGGHLILLVGFNDKGFYFHDPDSSLRSRGRFRFISFKVFISRWRGKIVVVK